jgi:hypothetical protein
MSEKIKIGQIVGQEDKVSAKGTKFTIFKLLNANNNNEFCEVTAFENSKSVVVQGAEIECDVKDYNGKKQYTVKSQSKGGFAGKSWASKKYSKDVFVKVCYDMKALSKSVVLHGLSDEEKKMIKHDDWMKVYPALLQEAFKSLTIEESK